MIVLFACRRCSPILLFSTLCLLHVFMVITVNGIDTNHTDERMMKQTMKEKIIQRELSLVMGKESKNITNNNVVNDPRGVKCVLIISSGRAGTTKLMDELQILENTFHIQEPFCRSYSSHSNNPLKYEQIFSCDVYQNRPEDVLWIYACRQTSAFMNYRHDCERNPKRFGSTAYKFCKQCSIRILKTIRFDRYHDLHFPTECSERKIINNVRHPWNLGKSVFAIGWGVNKNELNSIGGIQSELRKVTISRCETVKAQLIHLHAFLNSTHWGNAEVLNIIHDENFTDHTNSLRVLDFIFKKELTDMVWKKSSYPAIRKAFVDHLLRTGSYFKTLGKPFQRLFKQLDKDSLDGVWAEAQKIPACRHILDYIDTITENKNDA
eukprot:m.43041 g.43041  ORF g.43041 m.43041 type:complete len:379 (+) comp7085_c0_seq1:256-1392(+)